MRAFAQKTSQTTPAESNRSRRRPVAQSRLASPLEAIQRTSVQAPKPIINAFPEPARETQPGHRCACGGQCPACKGADETMHAHAAEPAPQAAAQASGELAGAADDTMAGLPITGERPPGRGSTLPYREATELVECMRIMGDAAYCREVVLGEEVSGPRPFLQKTTVGAGLTTGLNGEFSWPSRWSVQNATATTSGWIVQGVNVTQTITDAAGTAVVPGQGGHGGLQTAWYPLWEAWEVRGGQVFVGGSATPHNADTYGQNSVGANTQGTTSIVGRANFYPNLTLPADFTVRNAAPAWSLPVTNSDPGLIAGTGWLTHNLTATWDSVAGTGATTVTTV